MTIDTGGSEPVSQKPYPIAMKNYQWVKEEIEKLLTTKVICGSRSSWSAPIIIVPKGDGGKQLVINYRALNKVTRNLVQISHSVEVILKYAEILWNRTLVLLEDKLSSTTVDFIRSEGKLKTKHLIRFGSLRSLKSVKPNGNWKPKKFKKC